MPAVDPPALVLHVAATPESGPALREALPTFAAEWGAESGRSVTVDLSYGSAHAITRAVVAGEPLDVVVLPAGPSWLALAASHHVEASTRVDVAADVIVLGVRPGAPAPSTWTELAVSPTRLVLPDASADSGAHLLLGALWAAVWVDTPEFAPAAEGALRHVRQRASSQWGTPDAALGRFAAGEGDAVLSTARELASAAADGVAVEAHPLDPVYRIVRPAGVVIQPNRTSAENLAAHALARFLGEADAARAFTAAGFAAADVPGADLDAAGWGPLLRATAAPAPASVPPLKADPAPITAASRVSHGGVFASLAAGAVALLGLRR